MTIVLVVVFVGVALLGFEKAYGDAGPGDTGQNVVEVQYLLRSFGYVLAIDGRYGSQTMKAVKHFQRSSGLLADGRAGPITMAALGGESGKVGSNSNPSGLRGLPFAPAELAGCDEMAWYRQQAGLPEVFDAIGFRESRCQNDVGNACCHSWFGLHAGNINNQWSYGPFIKAHCQVFAVADYRGNSPLQKQKAACFAKVLYDISGMTPWAL